MLASELPETLGNAFSVQRRSAARGSALGYTRGALPACEPGLLLLVQGPLFAGVGIAVLSIGSRLLTFAIALVGLAALAPARVGRAAPEGWEHGVCLCSDGCLASLTVQ